MKTDLVERLRRQYVEQGTNYVQEAADAIEQVVAERDALRAEVEGWMKDNSPGGWIYELRKGAKP
jgi:hypothetical protein